MGLRAHGGGMDCRADIHVMDTPPHGTHPQAYVSFEGLPDASAGSSLDHGVLAQAVCVLLGLDHVGDHLHQPVLREGVVRTHHVHLHGERCAYRLLTPTLAPCPGSYSSAVKLGPQPVLSPVVIGHGRTREPLSTLPRAPSQPHIPPHCGALAETSPHPPD